MSRRRTNKGKKKQQIIPRSSSGAKQTAAIATNQQDETLSIYSHSKRAEAVGPNICQHKASGENEVLCDGHHTGLLTRNEIEKYGIIKDHDNDCLQITSYDLRLGEGHMIYDSADRKWLAKWVCSTSAPNFGNPPFACEGSNIVIPPYGMALIQLRETIDLLSCIKDTTQPVMICGHFDLKLSRVREGLISQQATQVEPGYHGKLFCYLFNQTGDEIPISYSDISNTKIATIEFQYASCIIQCDTNIRQRFLESLKKLHEKYTPPYCSENGIMDVRYFDGATGESGKLPKHGGLSSIAQNLIDAQENARKGCDQAIKEAGKSRSVLMNWVLRLAIGLPAIIFSLLGIILAKDMHKDIVKVWELITTNRGEVEAAKTEVNAARDSLSNLRDEAQRAYEMAKKELDDLDVQKKSLQQKEIPSNSEHSYKGNQKAARGSNQ